MTQATVTTNENRKPPCCGFVMLVLEVCRKVSLHSPLLATRQVIIIISFHNYEEGHQQGSPAL